jgi:hypothetical protein
MQIFAVDEDPVVAAACLGDRHVVKMCLETAQILCTVSSAHGIAVPYRPTHVHHPCVVWAGESQLNWDWLHAHGLGLSREYRFRYRRQHACESVIAGLRAPPTLPQTLLKKPLFTVKSLKPEYQTHRIDAVDAHRDSYRREKKHCHQYERGRDAPYWLWEMK